MNGPRAKLEAPSLLSALREEADLSEKGLDFMDDEDLANETRVQIGLLRDAADTIERLAAVSDAAAQFRSVFYVDDHEYGKRAGETYQAITELDRAMEALRVYERNA